jgi:hypothetical protein
VIQSILNESVDLTDYPSVLIESSQNVTVTREPHQMGGQTLACRVENISKSKHGIVLLIAPDAATWDLTRYHDLTFALFEGHIKDQIDLAPFYIRLGRGSSYFEFRPEESFWSKRKRSNWFPFTVPLTGSSEWQRSEFGSPSLSKIKWIEFHFDVQEPILFHINNVSFKERKK